MNGEVVAEIRNSAKVMPGTSDALPTTLSRVIIPTLEVNPKIVKNAKAKSTASSNSTSATIITTPTNQDFYLIGASLSVIKDVVSTSNQSKITYYQDGLLTTLIAISSITLTVQSETISCNLNHPIKVDRGSVIAVVNSSATAEVRSDGTIYYFLDETSTLT